MLTGSRRVLQFRAQGVAREDEIAIFGRLMAGEMAYAAASLPGLPFLKSTNPQPRVAAYFFESFHEIEHSWRAADRAVRERELLVARGPPRCR